MQVVVAPEDKDLFVITVKQAIEACVAGQKQNYDSFVKFQEQFQRMLVRVGAWIERHRNKIQAAHLTMRDSDVLFVAVQESPTYDPGLEDELTSLDIDVARDQDLDLIRLNVLCIPPSGPDGESAFLIPGRVLEYRLIAK